MKNKKKLALIAGISAAVLLAAAGDVYNSQAIKTA